jgi:uncharacterized delta-60 repeat protein
MLALALTAALALSAPGTLDRSFGHDGRVVTSTSSVPGVAGLENVGRGRVLLAGTIGKRSLVLIRYRRDGSRDNRFGRKGVSSFRFDRDVTATDTLLDAQGRLLVAGSLGGDALVLRFDRAGHLDPSLDQDGIAVTDFGPSTSDQAEGIALQADGSIVVAASLRHEVGEELGVTRLDPRGNVDRTFGKQGFVRRERAYTSDSLGPSAVGVLPDRRLVVAYTYSAGSTSSADLLRLLPDGSPDPAFDAYEVYAGGAGINDLVVQPSTGRLFLSGSGLDYQPGYEFRPSAAAFDPSSATAAWRTPFEVSKGLQVWANRLALDAKGRAVVAGSAEWWENSKRGGLYPQLQRADMIVARIRANGRLDRCFGKRAVARIHFRGKLSTVAGIALGERGSITIAGPPQYAYEHTPHRFELARLRGGNCAKR